LALTLPAILTGMSTSSWASHKRIDPSLRHFTAPEVFDKPEVRSRSALFSGETEA
jgi:hypothetical protein